MRAQIINPPNFVLGNAQPVTIEEADQVVRANAKHFTSSKSPRGPETAIGASRATREAHAQNAISGVPTCAPSSQPSEFTTLAASLKCDPDLIFEYVHDNIEFEPTFGSNKGALGTLLDQRGNDIDQVALFAALLSAAGFTSSQIGFQYGYIRINGVQASDWLGVKNDGRAIANLLANGGIPITTAYLNGDATLNSIDAAHVWLQLQIGGSAYVFDPSFKQHLVVAGLNNLQSIMGYTQNQFLGDAGGIVGSGSIGNLGRANIRNDLTVYASRLVDYISSNVSGGGLNEIVGGKAILPLTGSPLRQTALPYLSPSQPSGFPQNWGGSVPNAYRTCFTISMPGVTPASCASAATQTIQLYSDEAYGHRITVSSVPTGSAYVPTLLIDGAPPSNGQNTGTVLASGNWMIGVAITHPYASLTSANQTGTLAVDVGGFYVIGNGWGPVGRGTIEKHRKLLAQALAGGNPSTSEIVLGESLAIIDFTWQSECAFALRLGDGTAQVTTQYHHALGIAGQTAIQGQARTQAPYIDLPLNFVSIQPQSNYAGSGLPPATLGAFFSASGVASSLESTVLEQTQASVAGMQAASTVRLVDLNVGAMGTTYFADGTTSAGLSDYFTSIRPGILAAYVASDIAYIDSAVSSNGSSSGSPTGNQVLIPANGRIGVGLWTGSGYSISRQQGSALSIEQKITGGLSGGFSGSDVSPAMLAASTQFQIPVASGDPGIPAGVLATVPAPQAPKIGEPIDAIGGAYTYNHTDLATGGGVFPYALPFERAYTSSSNAVDGGLGNGWSHNFAIRASRSSDPFAGLGDRSPIAAAAAIAATVVAQDLLSGARTAQLMTVAWVTDRWLTDQLTNNAVMIAWPQTNEIFTLLAHPDGSATARYAAPLGSAVALTGSSPDAYGNFTTFSYLDKDRSQLNFNPLDATANAPNGQIASISWPNGMSVNFAYGYGYNNSGLLTKVTNNLGRALALSYTGPHLATVTDDTGRSATYGYDGNNNLLSAVDPMGHVTTFGYDGAAGHLTQVFYPSFPSSPFVTNVYDSLGRVSQQSDADHHLWTFYFGGARTETIDAASARHVTYQTSRGKIVTDIAVLDSSVGTVFNDTGQQNGLVNVSRIRYDGQDRPVSTTAPEGQTNTYGYSPDLLHNLVLLTQSPKPGSTLAALTTVSSYDPIYNRPGRIVDPLGLVTQMRYDAATGNLLSVVADAGDASHFNARTAFGYTAYGQLASATDPLGSVTVITYDASGNPTSTTRDASRLNQRTSWRYDAQGDAVATKDPNGNVSTSSFDADRRLTTVTMPATAGARQGLTTTWNRDADGRIVQVQKSADGVVLQNVRATYSPAGQPLQHIDANGNVTQFRYDALERLQVTVDALGRTTVFGYDALGRRTGVFAPAIQGAALVQVAYTPDGLPASLTDANGHTTGFAYDGLDRLATTSWPDGSTVVQGYDADGNVLTRTTRKGDRIVYGYDTLNRLSSKSPASSPVVNYAYDLTGRLIGVSDNGAALVSAATPGTYATTLTYDAVDRPVNVGFGPAVAQTFGTSGSVAFGHAYNGADQRIAETTTDDRWTAAPTTASNTSYSANNLNQYSAIGAVTPTYDGNGNLTFDGTFTYGYDVENRMTSASGAGNTVVYAYDASPVVNCAYDLTDRRITNAAMTSA